MWTREEQWAKRTGKERTGRGRAKTSQEQPISRHTHHWSSLVLMALCSLTLTKASAQAAQELGKPRPLVIARGGSSILLPDMSLRAYSQAASHGADYLSCTAVLTKDKQVVCRPGIDMGNSTDMFWAKERHPWFNPEEYLTTEVVEGEVVEAFFSTSFDLATLKRFKAIQPNVLRSFGFNSLFDILTLKEVLEFIKSMNKGLYIDIASPSFFNSTANMSIVDAVTDVLLSSALNKTLPKTMVACSDLSALDQIKPKLKGLDVPLIFKMLGEKSVNTTFPKAYLEPSTGKPYSSFLTPSALSQLAKTHLLEGILVPKTFIFPQVPDILGTPRDTGPKTSLVRDAQNANLTVHVYQLANDDPLLPWQYGNDNDLEYLALTDSESVDGFLTDNPLTASAALSCHPTQPLPNVTSLASSGRPLVIGDEAMNNPAQTLPSYLGALEWGSDVIKCDVQMSADGVPLCREKADLAENTNINFEGVNTQYPNASYPEIQDSLGYFTFDIPWAFIQNLTAIQSRAWYGLRPFTQATPIVSLASFLNISRTASLKRPGSPLGLVISVQHPTFLKSRKQMDVVKAVSDAISEARSQGSLLPSTQVWVLCSEQVALKEFQQTLKTEINPDDRMAALAAPGTPLPILLVHRLDLMADPSTNRSSQDYMSPKGLKEIATYAWGISVFEYLSMEIMSYNQTSPYFFMSKRSTGVVPAARQQGLKVWMYNFYNEPFFLLYDYLGDIRMKLSYFVDSPSQGVTGIITDFPSSVSTFLGSKCRRTKAARRVSNYTYPALSAGGYTNLIYRLTKNLTLDPPFPAPAPPPAAPPLNPPVNPPTSTPPPTSGPAPSPQSPKTAPSPNTPAPSVSPVPGKLPRPANGSPPPSPPPPGSRRGVSTRHVHVVLSALSVILVQCLVGFL